MTDYDSALFEVVVADGARRLTTARPMDMGGEIAKWSIDSAFLTSTDGFEFEFIGEKPEDRRGLEMAPVELFVDGNSMLHGRIDITRRGDKGPSVVTCMGRDYIGDLVEGNCDPSVTAAAGATLEDTILSVCAPYGIVSVEGPEARQVARTKKPQKPVKRPRKRQVKDAKPEPGQGVYDWCNRILARHGQTMQPASTPGRLVLQAPNYDQDPIGRIIRSDSDDPGKTGCVLSGVATRDFSRVPTWALFAGRQGQPTEGSARTKANWDISEVVSGYSDELANILGEWAIGGRRTKADKGIITPRMLYRLLYFRDELAKTQDQINDSALRAVAERLKDTLVYEVTLRGIVNPETGYYWAYDTIVDVDDDVADVHEKLWVAARRFAFDGKELRTTLTCWRPGSFVIGDPNA
jgi:prophage tail gpP-like protein